MARNYFFEEEDRLLDEHRALSANDTRILVDGNEEVYADEFSWEVEDDQKSFAVIGSQWEYNASSTKKGTFKLSRYKTDSSMIQTGFNNFEIMTSVNAGEYGAEKIRLKKCKMKKIGDERKAGELIKESWEGSFAGFEAIDLI